MTPRTVKVLIACHGEQEALQVKTRLNNGPAFLALTEHAATYRDALALMTSRPYEVCLVQRHIGDRDGLELCQVASQLGCRATMILLTDTEEEELELFAAPHGLPFCPLAGPDPRSIQRVVRHALYRTRVERELHQAHDDLERQVQHRTAELSSAIASLTREIEQREIAERHVREAEERYRVIFEEASDAIVLINLADGRLVDFNSQAARQLGYTPDEFRTLSVSDIEALESPEQLKAHFERISQGGLEVFETVQRTKQGERRHILVSSRPITLRETPYLMAIWHDVTERKQMEEELRAAVIRLEQHNLEKTEFVANVSHELKTPLTSMIYGIHNLLRGIAGPLPDHAIQYLKLFNTECQRLVTTIDDILDLRKIDNKAFSLASVTTPLGHLIHRRLEALRPQADAGGITMTARIDPGVPFVRCDPNMIQRVLQNILGNAIKFTPRGGTVEVTTSLDRASGKFARVTVTDNGAGIPPEALGRITERYFRANNQASGSGLGLAISKDIMRLHGGTLTVASPPPGRDRGTEIAITLPLVEAPTVLVGDDDHAIQDLLRIHLEGHGYRVLTADSGQEVILMAEANRPDVILLDLVMEDIHGTTVILSLRGSQTIRYIPIIAITGATLDEATANILSRFSIPTLPKPWNVSELLDTIEGALLGMTAFQTPPQEASA